MKALLRKALKVMRIVTLSLRLISRYLGQRVHEPCVECENRCNVNHATIRTHGLCPQPAMREVITFIGGVSALSVACVTPRKRI